MQHSLESSPVEQGPVIKRHVVAAAVAFAAAVGMSVGMALPAGAAPSDQAQCRQDAHDAMVAASEEGTRGDFMSDTLFGNEPNMRDGSPGGPNEQEPGSQAGNVVPSQSPGPFVNTGENEPPRNDRVRGFDGGDLQALIRAACQS